MRIGLDLDNTIACYDELFRAAALEHGFDDAVGKTALRNRLRSNGREDEWTRLQGLVYGEQMRDASPYPGVSSFLSWAAQENHELAIISHRTRTPYLGPDTDLHAAAIAWLQQQSIVGPGCPIALDRVFFELTREDKMGRIEQMQCELFVDDLPEFLTDQEFPEGVRRIWFNPRQAPNPFAIEVVNSWSELEQLLK